MPKVFSSRTLAEFEAAAASIPLRPLDRAFEGAGLRPGTDPGGPQGSRREQFRRYLSDVDQTDPEQRDRLGEALGSLIAEVATSKQAFLVKAAERDGFVFSGGVFRVAKTSPGSFAVTSVAELASLDERARRLTLQVAAHPKTAIRGARELVESVLGTAALTPTDLAAVDAKQLVAIVARLGTLRTPAPRHARLAVGAAIALAGFVAETYAEHSASTPKSPR